MDTKNRALYPSDSYNTKTKDVINILRAADQEARQRMLNRLKTRESAMQSVEFITEEDGSQCLCLYHPTEKARLTHYILNRFEEFRSQGMTKKEYARTFFNCSTSHICNIITRESCPNDILIIGALMMDPPLSASALDHALMEIGRPGLFTNTYDQDTNLRNYVLRQLLDYIETVQTPKKLIVWPELADRMLAELDMELLNRQDYDYPVYASAEHRQAVESLWSQLKGRIHSWKEDAERSCTPVNYMDRRNQYLSARLRQLQLPDNHPGFLQGLTSVIHINPQGAKALFTNKYPVSGKHSNRGAREDLISGAIYLGCTLEETNLLLQEANHALLYVFRKKADDLSDIAVLLQHELDRARQPQTP